MLPTSPGMIRFMIHNNKDAAMIAFESRLTVLKKNVAVAPLTAISVSAKVGIALVTKNTSAIRQNKMVDPALIPNIRRIRKYWNENTAYLNTDKKKITES